MEVVERPVQLKDSEFYQLVTAKRSRGGIVARGLLRGDKILTKTQFRVNYGDFLISRRQIVHGACGLVPESLDGAIVSNEYAVLHPKEGLLLKYLDYLSHTHYFQQTCFHSSVGVDIEKMIFKVDRWLGEPIHVPPVEEQQRVIKIIGTWDKSLAVCGALISKYRMVKRSLIAQLLTGPQRLSDCSRMPWETMALKNIGEVIRGVSYKPEVDLRSGDGPDTVRLLRAGNIYDGRLNFSELQYVVRGRCSNAQLLRSGDVAICMANGSRELVGKAALFPGSDDHDYTVGAFCAIFRPREEFSDGFAQYLFETAAYRKRIAVLLAGSNINNLKSSDIERIRVEIPKDRDERSAVANKIGVVEQILVKLIAMQNNLADQRRALIKTLFENGGIRCVEHSRHRRDCHA